MQQDDGTEFADPSYYRSLVGGLNYLTNTRPDIMFSVSGLSRYLHMPTMHHLGAATRVLRYVAETYDFGIWYSRAADFNLFGYSDSDWGGCKDDGKSTSGQGRICLLNMGGKSVTTSGHMFSLGSGAISWSSKKQEVVALSSGEAEYIVVTSAACQAVWLRRLLNDLHKEQQGSTIILCDNKATIAMTKNPAFHNRTKHIDICYHFIRTLAAKGEIVLKYCGTKEQVADVLTKSISIAQHAYLRKRLGVCSFESRRNVE
ncbi:hypothetical protein Tco_0553510 [Tanacetum coccineum]